MQIIRGYWRSDNQGRRCHQDSIGWGSGTAGGVFAVGFFGLSLGFGATAEVATGDAGAAVAASAGGAKEKLVISILLETVSPESDSGSEFTLVMTLSKPEGSASDAAGDSALAVLGTTDTFVAAVGVSSISVWAKTSSGEKSLEPSGTEA